MFTVYIVLTLIGVTIALNQLFSIVSDDKQRNKMQVVENKLEKAGVTPSGSTLSHGMYIDKNTNKLVADKKASAVWYKRLI